MNLWMSGMSGDMASTSGGVRKAEIPPELLMRMRELEHQIGRLSLLNQALWELIRDRLNLADEDMERMAREVDLRDGVEDGRITDTPMRCPTCNRVSSSRHYKCLYCGQEFQRPVMG